MLAASRASPETRAAVLCTCPCQDGVAAAERASRTDGASRGEQPGYDEIRGLDPAEVAEAEGAERVSGRVEAVSGGRLDEDGR